LRAPTAPKPGAVAAAGVGSDPVVGSGQDPSSASKSRREICFYDTTTGNSVVREELESLSVYCRARLLERIRLFAQRDPRMRAENVRNGVVEIKARYDNLQPRALVAVVGRPDDHDEQVVVLRCFLKKRGTLPQRHIEIAIDRLSDWERRRNSDR
jgi:phage-related protein